MSSQSMFLLRRSLRGGDLERNKPSETPSQDMKEIAMSGRLEPRGRHLRSHK